MNDLYAFFVQGRNQRRIDKWHHYFEVYERHLARLRSANPTVLEIGVQQGGSMEMWRQYFGGSARIFGIDIDPAAIRHQDIAIGQDIEPPGMVEALGEGRHGKPLRRHWPGARRGKCANVLLSDTACGSGDDNNLAFDVHSSSPCCGF